MIKRLALATALGLALAGSAFAQSAPPAGETAPPAAAVTAPAPAAETAPAPAQESRSDAAAAPTTADACISAAVDLAQKAEGKSVSEPTLDKLDQLFSQMEALCEGKKFTEAMAVASDIRTVLDGN